MEGHPTGLSSSAGFDGFICSLSVDVIIDTHPLSPLIAVGICILVAIVFDRFSNLHCSPVGDTPDPLGWCRDHPIEYRSIQLYPSCRRYDV